MLIAHVSVMFSLLRINSGTTSSVDNLNCNLILHRWCSIIPVDLLFLCVNTHLSVYMGMCVCTPLSMRPHICTDDWVSFSLCRPSQFWLISERFFVYWGKFQSRLISKTSPNWRDCLATWLLPGHMVPLAITLLTVFHCILGRKKTFLSAFDKLKRLYLRVHVFVYVWLLTMIDNRC